MSRGASILGGIAAAACLLFAAPAGAATLIGDYQLQGTKASSHGGPALIDLSTETSFQTDTVMGVERQVLRFAFNRGFAMAPAGLGPGTGPYSEVVTFRFDDALAPSHSYARILDSTDGFDDSGLYDHNGYLDYFGELTGSHPSAARLFADDTYATVAMAVGGGAIRSYFNGSRVVTYEDTNVVDHDTLRFFHDDSSAASGGAVSCIRVYSGALTDAEVGAIGASPTCGAVTQAAATPTPTTTTTPHKKKCKKQKKKRSAESAKKKCRKKRKR